MDAKTTQKMEQKSFEGPTSLKKEIKKLFRIPEEIYNRLLPAPTASLINFSSHTLPLVDDSCSASPPPAAFFSTNEPACISSNHILRLRRLRLPKKSTIRCLVEASRQAVLDGCSSVQYAHLDGATTTYYPVWIITYWNLVLDLQNPIKEWARCREWVEQEARQNKCAERRELAEESCMLMNDIPWNIAKPGLSSRERTHTMFRMLGNNWLAESDIIDMLDLLKSKVSSNMDWIQRFSVQDVYVTRKLLQGYRDGAEAYLQKPEYGWLRRIGEQLVHDGASLMTVASLENLQSDGQRHWVAIVIDFRHRVLRYGDSLLRSIPQELKEAYQWWMSQHSADVILTSD
ncbi:hypothetical protein H0H92_012064, partial [Tricholoma furcatifolium]